MAPKSKKKARRPSRKPAKGTYCIIYCKDDEAYKHLRDFEQNDARVISSTFVSDMKGYFNGVVHEENAYEGRGFVFVIEHPRSIECPGCEYKAEVLERLDEEDI